MKNKPSKTKKSGESKDIPNEGPEPDQDETESAGALKENNTCSGLRENIALTLTDRQDQLAERLIKKIELLTRRLTVIEHGKNSKDCPGGAR